MKAAETLALPLPEAPYRGLEPFRFCDQAIFFEREVEAERLIRLVTRYRASLLYGESGVGKSSLINAGLIPKALAEEIVVERLRVQPRPGHEFVIERISRSGKEDDFLPSVLIGADEPQRTALSVDEFNKRVRDAAGATILLIFDQFEELVTLAAEDAAVATLDSQNRILNTIVSLIQDRQKANLRLLFVFREDYLAKFERFFYFCPELPDRFLRITPPPASALRRVLRGPFESAQIPPGHWQRTIPESVTAALERQLRPAEEGIGINLSKVQIAALQVWRSNDPEKELAGRGAHELVSDYLQDQLNRFREQRELAESLLALMITRQGTRKVISEGEVLDEIKRQDGVPAKQVGDALEKLVNETRLVKRDHHRGTTTYEIVSEFLVPWIRPLKLHREARLTRNTWLKRAGALVVLIGAVLGAIFFWKYTTTTLEARQTELVMKAQAVAADAQKGKDAAGARAQQALEENAQLKQRNEELESLLKTQGSDREKKLLDDLSGKSQELTNQQAQNRTLAQQLEKFREEADKAVQALEAEKKGRASDIAALRKELNDQRAEAKQSAAGNATEPGPPAALKQKETGPAPAAPVAQLSILALPHDKDVRLAAFSSNGHRVLTVSSNAAHVWNTESGASLGKPLEHQKDIGFASFSPDGTRVVTVAGNEVRLWDTESGMPLSQPLVQRKNVNSAALPTNDSIEVATGDGIQVLVLQADGNSKGTPLLSTNIGFTLLAPDGRLAVTLNYRSVQLWGLQFPIINKSSYKIGTEIPRKTYYEKAAVSFDSRRVALVIDTKIAQVYDVETGKPVSQPITTAYNIQSVALDETGRRMATNMSLYDAQVWDVATGMPLGAPIPQGNSINSVALSPDGRRLVVGSGKFARVFVITSN